MGKRSSQDVECADNADTSNASVVEPAVKKRKRDKDVPEVVEPAVNKRKKDKDAPEVGETEQTEPSGKEEKGESREERQKRKEMNRELREKLAADPSSLSEAERRRAQALQKVYDATQAARESQTSSKSDKPQGDGTDEQKKSESQNSKKRILAAVAIASEKPQTSERKVSQPATKGNNSWKEPATPQQLKENMLLRKRAKSDPSKLTEFERERAKILLARDERKKAKKGNRTHQLDQKWEERNSKKDARREYAIAHGATPRPSTKTEPKEGEGIEKQEGNRSGAHKITLKRTADCQKLGVDMTIHINNKSWLIEKVNEGLIDNFNKENPDRAVMPGDRIVKVNKADRNAQKILKEIQSDAEILKLVVCSAA